MHDKCRASTIIGVGVGIVGAVVGGQVGMGDGDLRPGPQSGVVVITRTRPGAELRFDYHRRISPSRKQPQRGTRYGAVLREGSSLRALSALAPRGQRSNKQQATNNKPWSVVVVCGLVVVVAVVVAGLKQDWIRFTYVIVGVFEC
jgi:hypothetical protein